MGFLLVRGLNVVKPAVLQKTAGLSLFNDYEAGAQLVGSLVFLMFGHDFFGHRLRGFFHNGQIPW